MNKFLQEIEEQPEALTQTLNYFTEGPGKDSLKNIQSIWNTGNYNQILFTGMGSSYFISYAATCMLNKSGITSFSINAGELLHYQFSLVNPKTMLVCISQSGESYEIVRILEMLPEGVTCIGICNEADSTLAKKTKEVLLCKAGKEDMTSTKTFTSTYLATYILARSLAGTFDDKSIIEIKGAIKVVAGLITHNDEWLNDAICTIAHVPFVQLIGRGSVYATVSQCALMFMEATRNPASSLYGGEFRHGPMEMVKEGFRAVVFAPKGATYEQSIIVTKDILKFGGKVLLITDETPAIKDNNLFSIVIPCANEELFAIPSVIPLQLIVNQWATESGNEPGYFTRGAKVTVIE